MTRRVGIFAAAIGVLLWLAAAPAWATCPVVPFVFPVGPSSISPSQMNSNFEALRDCVNALPAPAIPTLPTNADLAAAATTAYTSGVWRLDFAAGRGAPPLFFRPSTLPCTLNGGNGDNGSQVNGANNLCWIASASPEGLDVRQWGVKFDSATDNTTALQAAINWAASGNRIRIPPAAGLGRAKFSNVTATVPAGASLTIAGAGQDGAMLESTAVGTIAFDLTLASRTAAVHFENMTICTSTIANGSTALRLTTSGIFNPASVTPNTLTGLTIRGCDGYGNSVTDVAGFTTGIVSNQASMINLENVFVNGPTSGHLPIAGTFGLILVADPVFDSVQYNIHSSSFNYLDTGVQQEVDIQGLTVSQSNFVNDNYGIVSTGVAATVQLVVADSEIVCFKSCIFIQSALVQIHDNLIATGADNAIGIAFQELNDAQVHHNQIVNFLYTGTSAVTIVAPPTAGVIGGMFDNNYFGNVATGVSIPNAGAYLATFHGNRIAGPGTMYAFNVAATVKELADGAVPFASLAACGADMQGNRAGVTDSNTAVWGDPVAAGGVNHIQAVCNNGTWRVYSL